jgi:hypothetical protein
MKKLVILIFGIIFFFSCSSGNKTESSDSESFLKENLSEIEDKIKLYIAASEVMQVMGKLDPKDYEGFAMLRNMRQFVEKEYDKQSYERETDETASKDKYLMSKIIDGMQESNRNNNYGKWFMVLSNEYAKVSIDRTKLTWKLVNDSEYSKIWIVSETKYDLRFIFIVEIFGCWDMYGGYEGIWAVSVRPIEGQPYL